MQRTNGVACCLNTFLQSQRSRHPNLVTISSHAFLLTTEEEGMGLGDNSGDDEAEEDGEDDEEDADEEGVEVAEASEQNPPENGQESASGGVSSIQQGISMLTTGKVCPGLEI